MQAVPPACAIRSAKDNDSTTTGSVVRRALSGRTADSRRERLQQNGTAPGPTNGKVYIGWHCCCYCGVGRRGEAGRVEAALAAGTEECDKRAVIRVARCPRLPPISVCIARTTHAVQPHRTHAHTHALPVVFTTRTDFSELSNKTCICAVVMQHL